MSVSIISDHKVISAAVNTHDVSKVLGRASLDVGALCSSGSYINRWAKYKPVIYKDLINTAGQWDATNNTWKSTATWWKGTTPFNGCGLTVSVYSDLIAMCDAWIAKEGYSWHDFWAYAPPTGGTAAPYRLTDFAKYIHYHQTKGEDYDKVFAGWHIGTDNGSSELHRYQDDGTFYIGENSTIQMRNLGTELEKLLLQLSDIEVKYGETNQVTLDLASFHFGVAFVMNYTSSTQANRLYSFITCQSDFKTSVTPSESDQSSGKDLRITPNFPNRMLTQANGGTKILALPFLSLEALSDTGVNAATNPCWQGNRSSYSGSQGASARFVPLPYFGKEMTLVVYEGKIKMVVRFGTCTASTGSLSTTITVTASSTDGTAMAGWGANDVEIVFQVFPNGQVPPVETRTYLPASSNSGWSGSTTQKTYTSTYTPGVGDVSTNKYEAIVTLNSFNGNVAAASGDSVRVNF